MSKIKYIFIVIIIILIIRFVFSIFGHQFAPIKNYPFDLPLHQLVRNIDSFLLKNPEYKVFNEKGGGGGFIEITIPQNGDQFMFRLNTDSWLSLYSAGKQNKPLKNGKNINYFSEKRLIKSFEEHFIKRLENVDSFKDSVALDPFALIGSNEKTTNNFPDTYIKRDTLITIEIPKASVPTQGVLDVESFLNNLYSNSESSIRVTQYNKNFSINRCCVGKVEFNKIYITAIYRQIGQKYNCKTLDIGLKWDNFIKSKAEIKIIKNEEQILYRQNWME